MQGVEAEGGWEERKSEMETSINVDPMNYAAGSYENLNERANNMG